jgi:uncharacterized membrane protein
MKKITLSAFIVLALISIDLTISMAYAKSNITIYKVTKVSSRNKLQLRAWPSPKSRVKVSLPYNAIDVTDTGKKKMLGKAKWLEVKWKNNRGWVNAHYLKKTGVLPGRQTNSKKKVASATSRNINSNKNTAKVINNKMANNKARAVRQQPSSNAIPQMPRENRYGQPEPLSAKEFKTSYSASVKPTRKGKILGCVGSSPSSWSITLDVANKKMRVNSKGHTPFYMPINYHEWASPSKVRMNIGGNKGRNIVDVNLEKTDACSTGLSRKNYMYEVNATINREFYSGCCETISH